MTSATELRTRARVGRRTAALPPTAAFYLLASVVVTFLASSSAPTPIYALYQAAWDFGPITTTAVFGSYALAVLVALLTLGKLSDHLGRRPVLLAALAGQAVAMIIFLAADGVLALVIARLVQGIATGAAIGAVGASLLDLHRRRGTIANAVAPGIGTGTGALVSAVVVQYLPFPTKLIYALLLAAFAGQAIGVLLLAETVTRKPGALATLLPELALPRLLRAPVLAAAPVLFAVWALAGFYGSLGPALTRQLTGSSSVLFGGLSLFVLAAVAAVAVAVLRDAPARLVMLTGTGALITGVVLTLVAISAHSIGWFIAGTAIAGVGFGGGFQGGIRTVLPLAAAHERAGVLSLLYVVCYAGMGGPAVLAGILVVHDGGLLRTAHEYGLAVIVLAGAAMVALLSRRPATGER